MLASVNSSMAIADLSCAVPARTDANLLLDSSSLKIHSQASLRKIAAKRDATKKHRLSWWRRRSGRLINTYDDIAMTEINSRTARIS